MRVKSGTCSYMIFNQIYESLEKIVSHWVQQYVYEVCVLWLWEEKVRLFKLKLLRGFWELRCHLICTSVERAELTREELGAFFKESDVVVEVSDLLLQVFHALLLVGPWWRAGGGHEHCPQHLLIGFGQRPAEIWTVSERTYCSQLCQERKLTLDRILCLTLLNALPAQRGFLQGSHSLSPLKQLRSPPGP